MKKKESTITINKSTFWMSTTILFAALFVISLFAGWEIGGETNSNVVVNEKAAAPSQPSRPSQPPSGVKIALTGKEPVLGDENAKITIVEFSDFQCPFCARAASGSLSDFKKSSYFENGEVNLAYKHFPLESIHPNARPAAIASYCAHQQGKFWEFHDLLFANQGSLSSSNYAKWAEQLGLDMDKFNSCVSSSEANSYVSSDLSAATAAGGRGTPYFVVYNKENGKTAPVSGAVPFANLEAAIKQVQ